MDYVLYYNELNNNINISIQGIIQFNLDDTIMKGEHFSHNKPNKTGQTNFVEIKRFVLVVLLTRTEFGEIKNIEGILLDRFIKDNRC